MKINRRFYAFFLSLVLAIGCIPSAAAADLSGLFGFVNQNVDLTSTTQRITANIGSDKTANTSGLLNATNASSNITLLRDGIYYLGLNANTSLCANVLGRSTAEDKASIGVDHWDGELNEQWRVVNRGGGYISLHPLHREQLCLNSLLGRGCKPGTQMTLHRYADGDDACLFLPLSNPDGSITLKNKASGLVMDLTDGDYSIGQKFINWTSNGYLRAQGLYFRPVSAPTNFDSYVPAGTYVLVPDCAPNSAVEVRNSSTSNGAAVAIWERAFQSNDTIIPTQSWTVQVVGSNRIILRNGNSKKALDVIDQSRRSDVGVHQWDLPQSDETKRKSTMWDLVPAGSSGKYHLINVNSGMALDVPFASAANGNALMQHTPNNGSNQTFSFLPVDQVKRTAERQIAERLDDMVNGRVYLTTKNNKQVGVYQAGTKYVGTYASEQCKGYAKDIHEKLFGYQIGSTQSRDQGLNYRLNYYTSKTRPVGSLTNLPSQTDSAVRNIFAQARPGDFIQVRRWHGGSHSMIVLSVDANGVRVCEANLDNNNGISVNTYSWNSFRSSNNAFTLYTAIDYRLH